MYRDPGCLASVGINLDATGVAPLSLRSQAIGPTPLTFSGVAALAIQLYSIVVGRSGWCGHDSAPAWLEPPQ